MRVLEEDLNAVSHSMSTEEKEFYKDGVILITGCAGAIGYEFLHYLIHYAGAKRIIGIDNCCLLPKLDETTGGNGTIRVLPQRYFCYGPG